MSCREKRGWINTSKTFWPTYATTTGASFPMTAGWAGRRDFDDGRLQPVCRERGRPSDRHLVAVDRRPGRWAENTGMSFTDATRRTIVSMGDLPVNEVDATAVLAIGVTLPQAWTLYRLERDGSWQRRKPDQH